MPRSIINNTATAGSERGSPIFIAYSKDGKRACTQCPLTVHVSPTATGVAAPELPSFSITDCGHGQASLCCRDGNCYIPKDSNDFPRDQSGQRTPVIRGGPVWRTYRSSGTKTPSSRPLLVHARNAPEYQAGDGCSKIPCPSVTGSGHSQATSNLRDGSGHIPRESRRAMKKCLVDAAHGGGVQYAWRSTEH